MRLQKTGDETLLLHIVLVAYFAEVHDKDSGTGAGAGAAHAVVLTPSETGQFLGDYTENVHGYNWSQGNDLTGILNSYKNTGFQATNFGLAVEEINRMVRRRVRVTTKLIAGGAKVQKSGFY